MNKVPRTPNGRTFSNNFTLIILLLDLIRWQRAVSTNHRFINEMHCSAFSLNRLRGSRVLLAGLGGLGAEVAKNLILAGVKGLTLLDHEQVLFTWPSGFFSCFHSEYCDSNSIADCATKAESVL